MIAILIIEDMEKALLQLKEKIDKEFKEAVMADAVKTYVAKNMAEVTERLLEIEKTAPAQLIAVIDARISAKHGESPEPAEEALRQLADRTLVVGGPRLDLPPASLIFISAYDADWVDEARVEYSSEPYAPSSYFVRKRDQDWPSQVLKLIKERVYSPEVESLMNDVFGESPSEPMLRSVRVGSRIRGLTHRLELLMARIREHYDDLHPDLQARINMHFETEKVSNVREVNLR